MEAKNASDSVTSGDIPREMPASYPRHARLTRDAQRFTTMMRARGKKLKSVAEAAV